MWIDRFQWPNHHDWDRTEYHNRSLRMLTQ